MELGSVDWIYDLDVHRCLTAVDPHKEEGDIGQQDHDDLTEFLARLGVNSYTRQPILSLPDRKVLLSRFWDRGSDVHFLFSFSDDAAFHFLSKFQAPERDVPRSFRRALEETVHAEASVSLKKKSACVSD